MATSSKPNITEGLYSPAFEHDACGVSFVVHMKGKKSHDIIQKALQALSNLEHRGACGCETNTGDGAGIVIQLPHEFLNREAKNLKISLPSEGHYGVGFVFMPQDSHQQS